MLLQVAYYHDGSGRALEGYLRDPPLVDSLPRQGYRLGKDPRSRLVVGLVLTPR